VGHPVFSSRFPRDVITSLRIGRNCGAQTEEVPGIAVFLEERAVLPFCALGIEADVCKARNRSDGDDVPGIVSNHVGGDEIDLLRGVLSVFLLALAGNGNAVPQREVVKTDFT